VATAEEAKLAVLELIPLGSEVHTGASATLETLGLSQELPPFAQARFLRTQADQKQSSFRRRVALMKAAAP
jgi:hypothetical protein